MQCQVKVFSFHQRPTQFALNCMSCFTTLQFTFTNFHQAINIIILTIVNIQLPGIFTLLPNSTYDYNLFAENNGYTSQYTVNKAAALTAGKMLGGSTGLHHLMHVRGIPSDYSKWVEATGDNSWSYDNLLEYFMKSEKVIDEEILADRSAGRFQGTDGYMQVARQSASDNAAVFSAFEELGYENVLNANTPDFTVGITEPLLYIADGYRQSGAEYLKPLSERSNFNILKNTQVTKVLFDDNNKATGVEATLSDGTSITINAELEVVLTAGAFFTPQILMLSGVGPADHLNSLEIPVISDLPVGKNLIDHIPTVLVHALQEGEPVTAPANPHLFPVPATTAYSALDKTQGFSDYQSINLIFPPDHTAFIQICSLVAGYNNDICQAWFDGGAGHATLLSLLNIMNPLSRGEVLLRSTDPNDPPLVHHGIYSNDTDLENMALYIQDFARIVETETLKAAGAFLIDIPIEECADLDKSSLEWFKCYALGTSTTMWYYSSTCSMGSVLDNRLRVKGVEGLRVADASAMPYSISGNINAAVMALAEKAADLIKAEYGVSPRYRRGIRH